MVWLKNLRRRMFGGTPVYDGTGGGRRALAWMPGNPGAVAALSLAQDELRAKSRDLVRRNAWAAAGIEAFVANAIGTGIKPQSMVQEQATREAIHSLWWDWCEQADAAGLTDFYGLQALATRAMLEGGEALIRLRYRHGEDGLPVALQIQVLEAEHLPTTLNRDLPATGGASNVGNVIRAGIEFDRLGRRVAYHLYRSHPNDGLLAPMSSLGGMDTVRVDAQAEAVHFRPWRHSGHLRVASRQGCRCGAHVHRRTGERRLFLLITRLRFPMIKLNLPREPHWIKLAAGVRLQVRPATTAVVMAARHAASKVAGTDTAAAGERTATLITELAKLAVLAWEGVADDKGKPAAVTPEGVAALMEHWLLADAFEREYLAGLYALDAEKNA